VTEPASIYFKIRTSVAGVLTPTYMTVLNFSVPGIPKGKGAARASFIGGKPRSYTPTPTRDYMATVKHFALLAGATPKDCPCEMIITAYFPIPTSYTKKIKALIEGGNFYYTKKPDTDNLSKIKDALNGIAFRDDALVWKESVTKYYANTPRLEITINYYESPPLAALPVS
jgi:Holliday junction resolvase RusA-like endonuclease